MADFPTLILRLNALRLTLAETLRSKGVATTDEDTLAMLVEKTALIDSTSGMNQIRNGYQLFRGNMTMAAFPTFDTALFDSMYQMCYGCWLYGIEERAHTRHIERCEYDVRLLRLYEFAGDRRAGHVASDLRFGAVPWLQKPTTCRRRSRFE